MNGWFGHVLERAIVNRGRSLSGGPRKETLGPAFSHCCGRPGRVMELPWGYACLCVRMRALHALYVAVWARRRWRVVVLTLAYREAEGQSTMKQPPPSKPNVALWRQLCQADTVNSGQRTR